MERQKKALDILNILKTLYPQGKTLLNYETPFQLLIATMLAAQCTDDRVNMVTPALFAPYPDCRKMAEAPVEKLEELIRSTGFYNQKAKNIKATSKILKETYRGEVPCDIETLITLPGVGRKTANVMAGIYFKKPAIIVDTHFKRVLKRLGLTASENPDIIEREMKELIPPARQLPFSQTVNFHGRNRCKARKPDCPGCEIINYCDFGIVGASKK